MIIAIGDIHGNFESMEHSINKILSDQTEMVSFIQVGDLGIGFRSPSEEHEELFQIDRILRRSMANLFIIRGNHDNPIYWTDTYRMRFTNIKFVKDNSYYSIDGRVCFFAGGAISIDRTRRIQSVSYWNNECYVFEKPIMTKELDLIFTHDVPHSISRYTVDSELTKQWFGRDDSLRYAIIKSQEEMNKLLEFLNEINPLAPWYHGHYHASHITTTHGRTVHSLGIQEYKEVR